MPVYGWAVYRQDLIRRVLEGAPRPARVDDFAGRAFALEEEPCRVGILGQPDVRAVVLDHGGEDVAAGNKVWRDVERLIAPMHEIAVGGAPNGALAAD